METTIRGRPVTVTDGEVIIEGDPTASTALSVTAATLIRRQEQVALNETYPSVPASFDDPYATVATVAEAARRAKIDGFEVHGIDARPGVVY
jgi:hypothetical protein